MEAARLWAKLERRSAGRGDNAEVEAAATRGGTNGMRSVFMAITCSCWPFETIDDVGFAERLQRQPTLICNIPKRYP